MEILAGATWEGPIGAAVGITFFLAGGPWVATAWPTFLRFNEQASWPY